MDRRSFVQTAAVTMTGMTLMPGEILASGPRAYVWDGATNLVYLMDKWNPVLQKCKEIPKQDLPFLSFHLEMMLGELRKAYNLGDSPYVCLSTDQRTDFCARVAEVRRGWSELRRQYEVCSQEAGGGSG